MHITDIRHQTLDNGHRKKMARTKIEYVQCAANAVHWTDKKAKGPDTHIYIAAYRETRTAAVYNVKWRTNLQL